MKKITFILLGLVLVAGACNRTPAESVSNEAVFLEEEPQELNYKTVEFADVSSTFKFSGQLPMDWQVEYVAGTDALNIYDPSDTAESNLEKSQIFIRHFTANSFLTLSTVDILNREEMMIGDREAVKYEIKKKANVANFPNQPIWRSGQHQLIDIRVSKSNPSVFYVFAYNPDLKESTFEGFINSLIFY
jgi:hypothetical protein